jgi:hypothetical protein
MWDGSTTSRKLFLVTALHMVSIVVAACGAQPPADVSHAALVAPGGTSVGTTMISEVAAPHFYRVDKMIVPYIGNEVSLLILLDGALGPQFAAAQVSIIYCQRCRWIAKSNTNGVGYDHPTRVAWMTILTSQQP